MRGRNYNGLTGFSSHAASMLTSLKNNLKPRNIDRYKSSSISAIYKKGSIDKKASPKLLTEIREKTIRENRVRRLKNIIILSVIAMTFFLIIRLS
ncbi:MAG: hypothetical protein HWD85_12805 [Flavobacteriaceae bacterium]|nr:hypothetical protein [Flavobacteriaceae bacterium]